MPATVTNGRTTAEPVSTLPYATEERRAAGTGWVLFAAIMFVVAASLNIIWGIAAVSGSKFFVAGATYILSDLNTWGWVAIGFGAVELLAVLSMRSPGRAVSRRPPA